MKAQIICCQQQLLACPFSDFRNRRQSSGRLLQCYEKKFHISTPSFQMHQVNLTLKSLLLCVWCCNTQELDVCLFQAYDFRTGHLLGICLPNKMITFFPYFRSPSFSLLQNFLWVRIGTPKEWCYRLILSSGMRRMYIKPAVVSGRKLRS